MSAPCKMIDAESEFTVADLACSQYSPNSAAAAATAAASQPARRERAGSVPPRRARRTCGG